VPILVSTAADPDVDVRYEAIVALGMRDAPDARLVVESALGDGDPKVRRGATSACVAHSASRAALARLVELAMNDDPPPNVLAARSAIVRMACSQPHELDAEHRLPSIHCFEPSSTGVRMGAPLAFRKTTTNRAGFELLALRPTT